MSKFVLRRGAVVVGLLLLVYAGLYAAQRPPAPPKPKPKSAAPKPVASKEQKQKMNTPTPGRKVVIETNKGKITAVLYEKDAPITTKNFISLVQRKFYNGLTFHRVEPGFVIQTGDPTATGSGGSDKTIPLEISPILKHDLGALGMARTNDPNSATSQFYITLDATHQLDGGYAVFGKVTDGMDVVRKIQMGDKMTKVYMLEAPKPAAKPKAK